MFDRGDSEYLKRKLSGNEVVLFLGAGFSADVSNRLGRPIPLGRDVARIFWELLYAEPFEEGTGLGDMYEAVLRKGVPHDRIRSLLEQQFLTREIPGTYDVITRPFWYRIYTTNIDDALPRVFARAGGPELELVVYPRNEPKERDQALDRVQAVYLHGKLPCRPDEITFSVGQYARRANEVSPLYQQFVGDYATHTTVFIGTELNEPLLWQL